MECTLNQLVYNCTIHNGIDLPYTSLTVEDTFSILDSNAINILFQEHEANIMYYRVSAVSSSQCVMIWGSFGKYVCSDSIHCISLISKLHYCVGTAGNIQLS